MQRPTPSHRRPTTRMTLPRHGLGSRQPDRARPERLRLIERTIAAEIPLASPESSINVIVLDDVSPRYMKAAAAVQAFDVNLGSALRSLLDAEDSDRSAKDRLALSVIGT